MLKRLCRATLVPFVLAPSLFTSFGQDHAAILLPQSASFQERLAASEVRRFLYLRTGRLLPIHERHTLPERRSDALLVATSGSPLLGRLDAEIRSSIAQLEDEHYLIRTLHRGNTKLVVLSGGSPTGTLYASYRLAEHMGILFDLHGDIIPDQRIPFDLPDIDEVGRPLFRLRGIQPFHDFPEGPDWWNQDDYAAIISQLAKLRMNFIGLHTYPEGGPNAEPTVWIGRPGDFDEEGAVRVAYPASYHNTLRGNWGYRPKNTGDYHYGAAMLFDRDAYGGDVMRGLCPEPTGDSLARELFNRTGAMLRSVFTAARQLGIKTCVGTETALTIPARLREKLAREGEGRTTFEVLTEIYRGVFSRIMRAYPIDYYWFWTPEGWTWDDAGREHVERTMEDLSAAVRAAADVNASFGLATCGWVLGPPADRTLFDRELPPSVSFSCINRDVGKAPVDPSFAHTPNRSRWTIPWMEDDPSLTAPQLWAGRVRKDAADALAYGCEGLLGIHWRTRVLSPNFLALALAGWDQSLWNPAPKAYHETVGPINGRWVSFPDSLIQGTEKRQVYSTIRDRTYGYRLRVPNGTYSVVLQFCEPRSPANTRRSFDVSIQKVKVIKNLDVIRRAGYFTAFDTTVSGITVRDGLLAIDFHDRVGFPAVAGIVLQGPGSTLKINCGGPGVEGYQADWPETPRDLSCSDLYERWALAQFGKEAAERAASLFSSIDGRLPEPATWLDGPGNLRPNDRPWQEVQREYAFVDTLASLRPLVSGPGNLERFDYWAQTFHSMRAMAKLGCLWGSYRQRREEVLGTQPIAAGLLVPPGGTGHGLKGEYYANPQLAGQAVVVRTDDSVDFAWGWQAPHPTLQPDSFSVRWTGTFTPDRSGRSRIVVRSDDGARLWIDGRLMIDDWHVHGPEDTGVEMDLVAGRQHDIRLEYFEQSGGASVSLRWSMTGGDSLRHAVESTLLPLRRTMVETFGDMYDHLLSTVSTSAELGTIMNWEQHNMPGMFDGPGAELEKILGRRLSGSEMPSKEYGGLARLIVPTVRTMVQGGEMLRLRALVLSSHQPVEVTFHWRPLGRGAYDVAPFVHVARGVYEISCSPGGEDMEYFVQARTGGKDLFFPATAPAVGQTVVVPF